MTLTPGQSLTFYEILGPIGAGGMGEVYRAKDTRLEREVAIKVLPEELADDEDRLRRFEREAKTLASLNHPNVAGIHGIDQVEDTCFLAMELVTGEDLEQRLEKGALPVDEAVDVCRQIAEGLEAAHEAGVVHRDLKPANVRITPEGIVKILDFGLAKPIHPRATGKGTTAAESDSFLMTEEGLILGTPTYMSPEQARGKLVDRRTDIWAFGCVLYECLTGKRVFQGETFTDVLASIVGDEPDWSSLPAVPTNVRTLLQRCMSKDPRVRLRDIGEARVLLQTGNFDDGEAEVAEAAPASRSRGALLVTGGVVLGAVLGALVFDGVRGDGGEIASTEGTASPATEPPRVRRFAQTPKLDEEGDKISWLETFLSPDGKHLAATTKEGIVVRSLDSLESTLIPGTEAMGRGGNRGGVAWSPDAEFLVYLEVSELVRVTRQGRNAVPLYSPTQEDTTLRMVAWLDDGRIVFGSASETGVRVHSIPEGGGPATEEAVISNSMMDGHLHGITAVPGGRFLTVLHKFFGDEYEVLTESDSEEDSGASGAVSGMRTLFVLPGEHIPTAQWVPGDHLLFGRGADDDYELWAVPLSMDPFEVAGEPFFVQGGAQGASVAMDGTLAYIEQAEGQEYQFAWWSPDGETEPIGRAHDKSISSQYLSNELGSLLYIVGSSLPLKLWKHDLRRGVTTEVSTGDGGGVFGAILPDGRIAFTALDMTGDGPDMQSYVLPTTGRGEPEPLLEGGLLDATRTHALVTSITSIGAMQLHVEDLASGERNEFRGGNTEISTASISPDGEWVIFSSDGQVFLTRFPSGEGEWLVSTEGGASSAFAPDGSAIHYVSEGKLYSVSLQTEPEVLLGTQELIGQAEEGVQLTAIAEQGTGRFLARLSSGAVDGDLVVVLGWASELAGR